MLGKDLPGKNTTGFEPVIFSVVGVTLEVCRS